MIKKCEIVLSNGVVTVVKYDGVEVQLPYIFTTEKFIDIELSNGKYSVVAKSENKFNETKIKSEYVSENIEPNETIDEISETIDETNYTRRKHRN